MPDVVLVFDFSKDNVTKDTKVFRSFKTAQEYVVDQMEESGETHLVDYVIKVMDVI